MATKFELQYRHRIYGWVFIEAAHTRKAAWAMWRNFAKGTPNIGSYRVVAFTGRVLWDGSKHPKARPDRRVED